LLHFGEFWNSWAICCHGSISVQSSWNCYRPAELCGDVIVMMRVWTLWRSANG